MAKKYKAKKREEKQQKKQEIENNQKVSEENTTNNAVNENKTNKEETKETKKFDNDKNKVKDFLTKKKTGKKKEGTNTIVIPDKKPSGGADSASSNNDTNKSLNETNFLLQKKDPNFKQGKIYKEDEIGKTLKSKGYKDLLDEKNGKFDVNKMNEDQYNQLRLLNNLHKVANNEAQDSDSEISVNSSISSFPGTKSEDNDDLLFDDISFKDMPKEKENKEIQKEKMEQCKEENKEIDNIKKEIEKEIGNDLLKEVINLLDKNCDKNEVKFDRELICKKVLELNSKGFHKEKVDKAVERIDEIFAVLMKDKLFA